MGRVGSAREMRKHVIIPLYSGKTHIARLWESKTFIASVTLNVSLLLAICYYLHF